jgi:hypothetical protein
MNLHAKRLECAHLAGAVARQGWLEGGSELHCPICAISKAEKLDDTFSRAPR